MTSYNPSGNGAAPALLDLENVGHVFTNSSTGKPSGGLRGINLQVRPGELVMLKGESGCGKTTLLTLVGALRRLQDRQGSITLRLGGAPVSLAGLNETGLQAVRQSIGFIFQRHNLLNSLTVLQNVKMAQQLHDTSAGASREAEELLTKLKLGGKFESRPSNLSGGQCQRVAIARALINRPRLLLADEPTAALDPSLSARILHEFRERADRDGMTAVIVTHDESIRDRADRIIEMGKEQDRDADQEVAWGTIHNNIIVAERKFILNNLRTCPSFAPLLPEKQVEIANGISICQDPREPLRPENANLSGRFQRFAAGQDICWPGDSADRFFLIRNGQVEVLAEGTQKRITTLEKGAYFGDQAVVRQSRRNAIVRAIGDVEVYIIEEKRWLTPEDLQSFERAVAMTVAVYESPKVPREARTS